LDALQISLEAILGALAQMGRPVVRFLRQGLDPKTTTHRLAGLGLSAPRDLLTLYGWHDGTLVHEGNSLDDTHFWPGFYFFSLEDAARQYEAMREDPRWRESWFPIFANGGGDFYAIETGHKDNGSIRGFLLGESDHPIEYESLGSMMKTLRACFETQTFFLGREGHLEMDDARHAEIAREFNPTLEVWSR